MSKCRRDNSEEMLRLTEFNGKIKKLKEFNSF